MTSRRLRFVAPFLAVLSISILSAGSVLPADGAPLGEPETRAVALGFLARHGAADRGIAQVIPVEGRAGTLARIYATTPAGYIAVCADDLLPAVLAYSFQDAPAAPGAGGDNPLVRLLRADLQARMDAGPASGTIRGPRDSREFQQWPPEGTSPTGGWLASNWTQNAPYNNLCPLDIAHGGSRSLAGCPAVAMAMILNYHETVQGTTFGTNDRYYHNFSGNAYWIPDASAQYGFPNFPTLNGYLQTLAQHWDGNVPLTNTDKAALTFACGVAARQVYSASVSGTYGVSQAYAAYQKFSVLQCRLVHDDDPLLYADLAENMQKALPAHLAVVDPGWTMGHNVVVDGYNSDDYFHLNFGWGGSYNGWYLLPEQIPYGLTVIEGVILDIMPVSSAVPGFAQIEFGRSPLTCYPVPANGRVEILLDAAVPGNARCGIYDVSGRLHTILLDGQIAAGRRMLNWQPDAGDAGVYFARLALNGRVSRQRIVVLGDGR